MTINELRASIDDVDDQLLHLLNERSRLATQIAAQKMSAGIPLRDLKRESEVLSRMAGANEGPLEDQAVVRIFQCVLRESCRVQLNLVRAACVETDQVS